jgi:hypothetical protein
MVIMIATFEPEGKVRQINVISGPQLLRQPAIEYVKGWHASEYSGIRNCPVVVNYLLDQNGIEGYRFVRVDQQHVTVYSQTLSLSDPSGIVDKRKRHFWPF